MSRRKHPPPKTLAEFKDQMVATLAIMVAKTPDAAMRGEFRMIEDLVAAALELPDRVKWSRVSPHMTSVFEPVLKAIGCGRG